MTAPEPAAFSWRRGLKHAVLPFGAVVAAGLGIMLAFGDSIDNPALFGEGIGRLSLFALLVGLGVSYLLQSGRKGWAIALSAGVLTLLVVAATVIGLKARSAADADAVRGLSAAERASPKPVVTDGRRWLEQSELGFRLHHPGAGFARAPELAAAMRAGGRDDGTHSWAWKDPGLGAVVLVSALRDAGGTEDALAELARGMLHGLTQSVPKSPGLAGPAASEPTTEWADGRGRASISVAAGGLHMAALALASALRSPPLTVVVTTVSSDPEALRSVRESLVLR